MRYENIEPRINRIQNILSARLQSVFLIIAIVMMIVRLRIPADSAYPPDNNGDHGTLTFMIAVIVLGVISVIVGGVSACNCLNKMAEKGPKRRWFRYTSPSIDFVFALLAGIAIWVSRTLPHGGYHTVPPTLLSRG